LAKIEPINGLYATIAAPIVYALLGKTRRLAVLPEAALSLVVGEAIRRNIEENTGEDHPHLAKSSEMACMITFLAALITFFAGIFRLGFVDVIGSPVLSPLLFTSVFVPSVFLDCNVLGLIVAVD
jgi:MFS superfamily sulfate permease-like transporter